jgi:HPt (histidine-containing phosphotransfer) domain-containing protein
MRLPTIPVKLNLGIARENLNNDSELIAAIAKVLIEDLPQLVAELRGSFEKNDGKHVKLIAHTIKGLASNFQAEPLMQLSEKLELEHSLLTDHEAELLISEIAQASEATINALSEAISTGLYKS